MTLQREIECVCVFLPHSPHFHSSQHLLLCPCLVTEHWPVTAGVSGGESRHRWIRLCFIISLLPRHEEPSALRVWPHSCLCLKLGITLSSSVSWSAETNSQSKNSRLCHFKAEIRLRLRVWEYFDRAKNERNWGRSLERTKHLWQVFILKPKTVFPPNHSCLQGNDLWMLLIYLVSCELQWNRSCQKSSLCSFCICRNNFVCPKQAFCKAS